MTGGGLHDGVAALVLAAGGSRRLGTPKRLLDYRGATLLDATLATIRAAGFEQVVVVLGGAADEVQARGTVNEAPVYAREVVKRALELHATALILVHNHPSGDPTPSRGDLQITSEIRQAAALFSIVLHDHLVIGNGRSFSFRQQGLLGGR